MTFDPLELPPPNYQDPISKEVWTLENIHLCIKSLPVNKIQTLDLSNYVGKTLRQVQEKLDQTTGPDHLVLHMMTISSDRSYYFKQSLPPDLQSLLDHVVQPGDNVLYDTFQYFNRRTLADHSMQQAMNRPRPIDVKENLLHWINEDLFTGVKVEQAELPPWLCNMLLGEEDDENGNIDAETIRAVNQEFPYFRVTSDQGRFGIMMGPEVIPMINLEGTGIKASQLCTALGQKAPPDDHVMFECLYIVAPTQVSPLAVLRDLLLATAKT